MVYPQTVILTSTAEDNDNRMLSQFIYHLQRIIIHDIIITVHFHIKIYIFFMTDLEIFTAFWLRSKCLYISQKRVSAKTVYEFSIHIP